MNPPLYPTARATAYTMMGMVICEVPDEGSTNPMADYQVSIDADAGQVFVNPRTLANMLAKDRAARPDGPGNGVVN